MCELRDGDDVVWQHKYSHVVEYCDYSKIMCSTLGRVFFYVTLKIIILIFITYI